MSSSGTVRPYETITVEVKCTPSQVGISEEVAIVFVSECMPKDRKGIRVNLRINGCVPSIDFKSLGEIFSEQYVVDSKSDFVCSEQVSAREHTAGANFTFLVGKRSSLREERQHPVLQQSLHQHDFHGETQVYQWWIFKRGPTQQSDRRQKVQR